MPKTLAANQKNKNKQIKNYYYGNTRINTNHAL